MSDYEARRLENIKRHRALVRDLELENHAVKIEKSEPKPRGVKRQRVEASQPTRVSARLANAQQPTTYDEAALEQPLPDEPATRRQSKKAPPKSKAARDSSSTPASWSTKADVDSMREGWTSWEPVTAPPTRDAAGVYHFESYPDFTPNKSPEEIMREGCFGGSYWRPLYSKHLKVTIEDDWRELPEEWTSGLDVGTYLTNPNYNAEVNKYGVACGQSIEEWEASGWIAHEYDVRGWFQWYCRFWMGRRCPDDWRQVSRWKKCVGEKGRWRRTLLKKYVQTGIRTVFENEDPDEEGMDVSPVVHQTCHHWAYEVRQEALDRFWAEGN